MRGRSGRFEPDCPLANNHPDCPTAVSNGERRRKPPLRQLTEQTLLDAYTPVAVLVNGQGDIFYIHGRSGRYLEPASGEVGVNNILAMAREGLRRPLTSALHQATANHAPVFRPGLQVKTNGGFTTG
jgi:two-component system, chemotaxis family, CheB/CheR fusion protein